LHAHHIVHWSDGGSTVPANLVLLCPHHHRALHHGEVAIEGDPEAGNVRYLDRFGRLIAPPGLDPPSTRSPRDEPPERSPFVPPLGEQLRSRHLHLELTGTRPLARAHLPSTSHANRPSHPPGGRPMSDASCRRRGRARPLRRRDGCRGSTEHLGGWDSRRTRSSC
jgi:hypothetical protein